MSRFLYLMFGMIIPVKLSAGLTSKSPKWLLQVVATRPGLSETV